MYFPIQYNMLKNFLNIIVRNLWKSKTYTLINVLGMGIGMGVMIWAIQNIRNTYSFDQFHVNKDKIYRVVTRTQGSEGMKGYCPLPVGTLAKNDFASIKSSVRMEYMTTSVKGSQEETLSSSICYTDPSFFDFFSFKLIKGEKDINDPSSILLSESEAKKYFGSTDAIGKSILLHAGTENQRPYTVKGIMQDAPLNSSITYDIIANLNSYIKADGSPLVSTDWKYMGDAMFIWLDHSSDIAHLEKDFTKYIPLQNTARKDILVNQFIFMPLQDIGHHARELNYNTLYSAPEPAATFGPLVLSLLILISSCLNFVNTTIVKSNNRLKEMGVRKVLGSGRMQLIYQLLMESGVIVATSLILSVFIGKWWIGQFNSMFNGIKLEANYLHDGILIKWLISMLLFVTLFAGIYPAWYVSRTNVSEIFRGNKQYGGANLFSRVLLGLQITIAFITVTAGFGFARNAAFQRDYDYGYHKNDVLYVKVANQDFTSFKNAMNEIATIEKSIGSKGHLDNWWRDKVMESEGVKHEYHLVETGKGYLEMMGVKILAGRDFRSDNDADINKSIVVSQNFCTSYGWKPDHAINKIVKIDSIDYSVIGVSQDVYMGGFFQPLTPLVFNQVPDNQYSSVIIRSKQGQLKSTYDQVKAKWVQLFPLKTFNGIYNDELAAEAQKVNESIAKIFSWFAIVSILLTATGMFALISLTILKKTREIAIRKVVGATLKDITIVINKSYFLIFTIAAFIGLCAGVMLTKLLMDLIFKVNIGINSNTVINTFASVLVLIALIIGIKVWQIGKMKPSQVLKRQ